MKFGVNFFFSFSLWRGFWFFFFFYADTQAKGQVKKIVRGLQVLVVLEAPQVFLICAPRVQKGCAKQCVSDFYTHMNNLGILNCRF